MAELDGLASEQPEAGRGQEQEEDDERREALLEPVQRRRLLEGGRDALREALRLGLSARQQRLLLFVIHGDEGGELKSLRSNSVGALASRERRTPRVTGPIWPNVQRLLRQTNTGT